MEKVRIGVIGCGGMARAHMSAIKEAAELQFTCASDVVAESVRQVVEEHGVKGFDDGNELLDSDQRDAVLIATPHYFHPTYSIAALQRGLHVLTEKPVSVTAKAAAEANAVAAEHPELKFAVMFQRRTESTCRKVKEIIDSGQLGEIRRVNWTATNWFRTQAYYDSGSWRATWEGEGGGVLMNQCPHDLDMFWWLVGLPCRVTAQVGLGKYHDIEVEDDVTAILEYPNGATGVFIASTGEMPGSNLFEVVGDRGKLTQRRGEPIELIQTDKSVDEFCRHSSLAWGAPKTTRMLIEPPSESGGHKAIHENFARAILHDEPLIAPAAEGIHSVEMANAMVMAGVTGNPVDVPTDHDAFDALLKELIEKAKVPA